MIALNSSHSLRTNAARLTGLVRTVEGWLDRRRQRRALLALDDKLLKDIGLSPADAWNEASKPFWRG
jgi:uncharacterized protein YjiS (DUF1127 family)